MWSGRAKLERYVRVCGAAVREEGEGRLEWVREFLYFQKLKRGTVAALVERVQIHEDQTVELCFRVALSDKMVILHKNKGLKL